MPNEPKTDPALLERLKIAAQHKMTAEEIRTQRVSFVYGNLPHDSTLSKAQVRALLDERDGLAA